MPDDARLLAHDCTCADADCDVSGKK